jgi:hypothetical protein
MDVLTLAILAFDVMNFFPHCLSFRLFSDAALFFYVWFASLCLLEIILSSLRLLFLPPDTGASLSEGASRMSKLIALKLKLVAARVDRCLLIVVRCHGKHCQ